MNATLIRRILAQQPKPIPEAEPPLPPRDAGLDLAVALAAVAVPSAEPDGALQRQSPPGEPGAATEPADLEQIRHCPPQKVSLTDLRRLNAADPALGRARLKEIIEAVQSGVESGYHASNALHGCVASLWNRALFVAVRQSFFKAWQPRNGLETNLLDQMAQYESLRMVWCDVLGGHTALARLNVRPDADKLAAGKRPAPISRETTELAARMIENCQRLYLRALRALMDLRRRPTLIVRSVKQVNVAHRQVNVAGRETRG